MLDSALKLARLGFCVFPLRPGTKIPLPGGHGVKEATKDETKIREWWTKYPNANIGLAVGRESGIVGIDLDSNHGATDEDRQKFGRTPTVKTKNGFHLYYKYPPEGIKTHPVIPAIAGSKDKTPAATLRSDGAYFVGPGSVVQHQDDFGNDVGGLWEYQWAGDGGGELSFWDCELAELPDFCFEAGRCKEKEKIGIGGRHLAAMNFTTHLQKRGHSAVTVLEKSLEFNETRNDPPKPIVEIIKEVEWAITKVKPEIKPLNEELDYLLPLGQHDTHYVFTSSRNRLIIYASAASLVNIAGLLNLMPLPYWQKRFPKGDRGEVNCTQAGSVLMEECRQMGIFDPKKIRGRGCWIHKSKLVLHLGDRLLIDDKEYDLNSLDDGFIYELGPRVMHDNKNMAHDSCQKLIKICTALNWKNPEDSILLAGSLAIFRLCGALAWRPMIWLTGPVGCGKSTIIDKVVQNIAGNWGIYIQGDTTEAGVRQQIKCDSRPVMFDEAEVGKNIKSQMRIANILELIRQASSDSGGRILKGTADGKGHQYKINSSFFLGSTRVSINEEADLSRFCILELNRNEQNNNWLEIQKLISEITLEFGDQLFGRMLKLWPVLNSNKLIFENLILEQSTARVAQQYSILLAGYSCLVSDSIVEIETAKKLISGLKLNSDYACGNQLPDEIECLEQLMDSALLRRNKDGVLEHKSIYQLIMGSPTPQTFGEMPIDHELLLLHGIDVDAEHFYVRSNHPALNKIFDNTKWADGKWNRALNRLIGAVRIVRKFPTPKRCVKIPLSVINTPQ